MSFETAKAFHRKLIEDEELQKALLDEAYETRQKPDWSAIAEQRFDMALSPEEAEAYEVSLESEEYELTEFELELVAAAVPLQCGDDGLG